MENRLSAYAVGRNNNFNLIRFVAAVLVLYSHSFALATGSPHTEPLVSIIGKSLGGIAVDIFFITSGLLIAGSYFSRKSLIAFFWARALRIYPALVVAVLFCVVIVGLGFTEISAWEYLSDPQTYKFLWRNSILFSGVEFRLPGVFADLPHKTAVNGSLWTLPYEVKMYAILGAVLASTALLEKWIRLVTFKKVLLVVAVASVCVHIFNHFHHVYPVAFPRLFSLFFTGAAVYACREYIVLSTRWFAIALALLLLSSKHNGLYFLWYTLALPYIIFYLAYVPSGFVRKFNELGDYSYGIYIYAFPVQQSLAAAIPGISVETMILCSFVFTIVLSCLSWHFIEEKFLQKKTSYVSVGGFVRNMALAACSAGRRISGRLLLSLMEQWKRSISSKNWTARSAVVGIRDAAQRWTAAWIGKRPAPDLSFLAGWRESWNRVYGFSQVIQAYFVRMGE